MDYFDYTPYNLQTAGETYSFKEDEAGDTYRFEVHSGDIGRAGDTLKERAEISSKERLDFDKTYTMTYDFMVEPGQKNTSAWSNFGQFHGTPDANDSKGLSPVFAIKLTGEQMRIVTRTDPDATTTSPPEDIVLYTDPQDIVRGHWYQMKVEIRFDPDGQGLVNVWRDGEQVVRYTGGVGYNDDVGPYWKMGIYRKTADEVLAVNYRDFNLKSGASAPSSPEPAPTEPTTDSADRLVGGNGADTLDGWAGNDELSGSAGNDVLNGGAGSDVISGGRDADYLRGGDGADVLKGNRENDTLVGGAGADTLTGGSGLDVFRFEQLDGSIDTLIDWSRNDKIDLSALGVNSDAVFVTGLGDTAPNQAAIHYTPSNGALYLDLNGGDASDAVQIAVLANRATALSHDSFLLG